MLKASATSLMWLAGIVSFLYLLANALYLLFLAVVFGQYSPGTPILEYLAFVAMNAIPAVLFAGLGIAGFLLWRSERFWPFGLSAIALETALAVCVYAKPDFILLLVK